MWAVEVRVMAPSPDKGEQMETQRCWNDHMAPIALVGRLSLPEELLVRRGRRFASWPLDLSPQFPT